MNPDIIARAESVVEILKILLNERKDLTSSQREEIENLIGSIQVNKKGYKENKDLVSLYPTVTEYIGRRDIYLQGLETALAKAKKWLDQEWQLLPNAIDRLQPILASVRLNPKTHWDLCHKQDSELEDQ
jgi:hypothetical protein